MNDNIIFISGIDTDVGKTIATGLYAKKLMNQGFSVITQKIIQTGCQQLAEDLLVHRRLQGIEPTDEDKQGLTSPYVFAYPCSPHLAAKLENREISVEIMQKTTALLAEKYDYVLIEGAGGLCVPYDERHTMLDYVQSQGYPIILVTSGKLGSINHTLLSLELCKIRRIAVKAVLYNQYPQTDCLIARETENYLRNYLLREFPNTTFEIVEQINV
ncbi:dethiobiotin synthase [Cricetibacter osteomyelitidis]|uniref:ATP-dependent dethiobiotin synthetase BioD n=1 Tax=Cricetibacter osteomyelitidis TaxID=1521931 RepID=A0A4R2SZ69_9PAST|nr:dethiobiotin synthase [Cricetibacter osteomyelitidis]TCP94815.1 dethiobiotin synthase [Cricetibacter osteomyelitidis]